MRPGQDLPNEIEDPLETFGVCIAFGVSGRSIVIADERQLQGQDVSGNKFLAMMLSAPLLR